MPCSVLSASCGRMAGLSTCTPRLNPRMSKLVPRFTPEISTPTMRERATRLPMRRSRRLSPAEYSLLKARGSSRFGGTRTPSRSFGIMWPKNGRTLTSTKPRWPELGTPCALIERHPCGSASKRASRSCALPVEHARSDLITVARGFSPAFAGLKACATAGSVRSSRIDPWLRHEGELLHVCGSNDPEVAPIGRRDRRQH